MNNKNKKIIKVILFILTIVILLCVTYLCFKKLKQHSLINKKEKFQNNTNDLNEYQRLHPKFIIPENINKNEIVVINNPIDPKNKMLWLNNTFTKNNFPGPDFQKDQKRNALKYILEKGKGVIDCGAHIGDFGVCLAVALKELKRSDIVVYCIDPSIEKCNFMKQVCELNNLNETNIKVLNFGLSDKIGKYSIGSKHRDGDGTKPSNTGGWQWIEDKNGIEFKTLDHLYNEKIIDEIGFFWMDAQWMEYNIITGGSLFLNKCKPYILMEYAPETELYSNGIVKKYHYGSKNELANDKKFQELFKTVGIKISNKGNELSDILLEFK